MQLASCSLRMRACSSGLYDFLFLKGFKRLHIFRARNTEKVMQEMAPIVFRPILDS